MRRAFSMLIFALLPPGAPHAQTPSHEGHQNKETGSAASASSKEPAAMPLTDGEVRRIDKAAKKMTIRHAPIANLEMPAMTMVFSAADAAMLDKFKVGDKVRFTAERVNGALTVTSIEAQGR